MIDLDFSHHALQRFAEFRPQYEDVIPQYASDFLTLEGAKAVRGVLKAITKDFLDAKKVLLPPNNMFGKFMKYGVKNEFYYRTSEYMIWVIVPEGDVHKVVTCTVPPKQNRNDTEDPMDQKPGVSYLSNVARVIVPWKLSKGVSYPVNIRVGYASEMAVHFGRVKRDPTLRSFLISAGNSTNGAVGYCARVEAHSEDEAVGILRKCLPEYVKAHPCSENQDENDRIEYLNVYFNPEKVTVEDISNGETEIASDRR